MAMKLPPPASLLCLFLGVTEACSSATPPPVTAATPRRRRRRTPQAAGVVAQPAPGVTPSSGAAAPTRVDASGGAVDARTRPSIGSPILSGANDQSSLRARWDAEPDRPRIRCDGDGPSIVPSTQSPQEPNSAAIVRAFLPAERRVVQCRPPTDTRGRFGFAATFSSNGAPVEYRFAPTVSREQAMCVGAALCDVRMTPFRMLHTTVEYEYLVYVPQSE